MTRSIDVAILGGGLVGNLLARQLRRHSPELSVAMFERDTERTYKVGESTVEIAANYLSRSGWKGDQTWGRKIKLPSGFDPALADLKVRKKIGAWQRLGIRRADGTDLPKRDLISSVILPEGKGGPAFLVYDNYRTILKWNRSSYFAVAVGSLADGIGGG